MWDFLVKWRMYAWAAVGVVAAVGISYGVGHLIGTIEERARGDSKASRLVQDHLREVGKLNSDKRQLERDHETETTAIILAFSEREKARALVNAAAERRLLDGTDRLRLQVTRCGAARAAGASGAASSPHEETRAELAPETSAALYRITADGDEAIEQLTGLQAYVTRLYKTCSGAKK